MVLDVSELPIKTNRAIKQTPARPISKSSVHTQQLCYRNSLRVVHVKTDLNGITTFQNG